MFNGAVKVTGTTGAVSLSKTATVTVNPDPLDRIVITPPDATLQPTKQQQFVAVGEDRFGNPVPDLVFDWTLDGALTGSTVAQTGLFTAGTETGDIGVRATATKDGVTRSAVAPVTVLPDPLVNVLIEPNVVELQPTQQQQFVARGVDQFGNEIPGLVFLWEALDGGTIDQAGLFTAGPVAATYNDAVRVTTTQGQTTLSASATVNLVPGPLTRLILTPSSVSLFGGESQQFATEITDDFLNDIAADVTWGLVDPTAGTLSQTGLFTAAILGQTQNFPGVVRVDASDRGITLTANATVEVKAIAVIVIESKTVFQGDAIQQTVEFRNLEPPGLGSYDIKILYDPAVIRIDSVLPGDAPFDQATSTIDAVNGTVSLSQTLSGTSSAPVVGSHRVAILVGQAIGPQDTTSVEQVETDVNDNVDMIFDLLGAGIPTKSFPATKRITKVAIAAQPNTGRAPLDVQFTGDVTDNPVDPEWVLFLDVDGNSVFDAATDTRVLFERQAGADGVPGTEDDLFLQSDAGAVDIIPVLNPLVRLVRGADFSVQFTVTNDAGTKTLTQTNFVRTLKFDFDTASSTGRVIAGQPHQVQIVEDVEGTVDVQRWRVYLDVDLNGVFGAATDTLVSWNQVSSGVYEQSAGGALTVITGSDPLFRFTRGGDYHVQKEAEGPAGTFSLTKELFVRTLELAFDAAPTTGQAPLDVQLTDQTLGTIDTGLWLLYLDDGDDVLDLEGDDGATAPFDTPVRESTDRSPLLRISEGGNVHVVRRITGPAGTFDLVKENLIRSVRVAFTVGPDKGAVPHEAVVTDTTEGVVTTRQWRIYLDDGDELSEPGAGDALVLWNEVGPGVFEQSDAGATSVIQDRATTTLRFTRGGDYHVDLSWTGLAGAFSLTQAVAVRTIRPDFTAVPAIATRTRQAPSVVVAFDSTPTQGVISSFAWDFNNDGVFDSTDPNPSRRFTSTGTFPVTMRATSPDGIVATTTKDIVMRQAPFAAFTVRPDRGAAPVDVSVVNLTTGDPTITFEYSVYSDDGNTTGQFDNGDSQVLFHRLPGPDGVQDNADDVFEQSATGTTSNITGLAEPNLRFLSGGNYHVSITATNGLGNDSRTRDNAVRVIRALKTANGSAVPISTPDATVNFQSVSEGVVTSWFWRFGDGATSSEASPTHIYQTSGLFNILLRVTGPAGTSRDLNRGFVTVTAPPVADFTADPAGGVIASTVDIQVTDTSAGRPNQFELTVYRDDGDGTLSTTTDTAVRWNESSGVYTENAATGTPGVIVKDPLLKFGTGGVYHTTYLVRRDFGGGQIVPSPLRVRPRSIHILHLVSINATPTSASLPEGGSVSVDFTLDIDGRFRRVRWDFQGDGTVDLVSTSTTATFEYTSPGVFTPRVQVGGRGGSTGPVAGPQIEIRQIAVAGFGIASTTPPRGPIPGGGKVVAVDDRSIAATAIEYRVYEDTDLNGVFDAASDTLVAFSLAGANLFEQDPEGALTVIPVSDPRFRFLTAADYHIRQSVSNAEGADELVRANIVRLVKAILLASTASASSTTRLLVTPGTQVTIDGSASEGTITDFLWDFEGEGEFESVDVDGGGVPDQVVSHTFNDLGTFVVVLRVVGPAGVSNAVVTIAVQTQPVARFNVNRVAGIIDPTGEDPFDATLRDQSQGNPSSWKWNFTNTSKPAGDQTVFFELQGDRFIQVASTTPGAISDVEGSVPGLYKILRVRLTEGGVYDVFLEVSNDIGTDGATEVGLIVALLAAFTAENLDSLLFADTRIFPPETMTIAVDDSVKFADVSEGPVRRRKWNLDGQGSFEDIRPLIDSYQYTAARIPGSAFNVVLFVIFDRGRTDEVRMPFGVGQ